MLLGLVHDFCFVSQQSMAWSAPAVIAVDADDQNSKTDGEQPAEGESEKDEHASHADAHAGGHKDPVSPVLLGIVVILLMAKIGGDLFERLSLPAVLGELAVGIIIGNMTLLTGWNGLDAIFVVPEEIQVANASVEELIYNTPAMLDTLARIGVVLLLFEVGLESSVSEMLSVGPSSSLVAILGVVVPIALGWLSGLIVIPDAGWQVHAFIGATLCATSVGITARVLKDLGKANLKESKIILGAAVLDDVLGLIVLAVVSGVIAQGGLDVLAIGKIIFLAVGFLFVALILGAIQLPRMVFHAASFLRGHGLLVVSALVICFGFSYAANAVGLAPIIGAFAAGLILESAHYREVGDQWKDRHLEEVLQPLTALLVPIFFVEMGIQVDLSSFQDPSVWLLAITMTVMAIIGKQVCSFGVREKGLNKIAVGLGNDPSWRSRPDFCQ